MENDMYDLDTLRLYKTIAETQKIQATLLGRIAEAIGLNGELEALERSVSATNTQLTKMIAEEQLRHL